MRLKKLELKSFKGIKDFIIKPNGKSVSIHGDNGTGKTTIADSVAFLLYGLDSHGNTFLPKPLDEAGEALHGVNSEVEAIFLFDDGQEITLKKSFYEKWTKKHGIAQKIFTGHTTKHSINGVPNISEKKYKEKIGEIATEPILKLLTNTKHFSEGLHWQERRSILLDICGDISDEEIIAGNESLSRIPEILAGKTLEEQKKIITAQKTKLNKELNELPVRIDEVEKGLPDVSGLDLSVIEKELSETEKALAEKNQEAARIKSGGRRNSRKD
jgi:DNA repair exonuclease SbcCD ATPase subunit